MSRAEQQLQRINHLAHWLLAFVLLYHGVVPKMWVPSALEQQLVQLHGLPWDWRWISWAGGVAEILLALAILLRPHARWPLLLTGALFAMLLLDVAWVMPSLLLEAFNPLTMNLLAIGLCAVALLAQPADPGAP